MKGKVRKEEMSGKEGGEERGRREGKRVESIIPQNWPTLKISPCTE